MTSHTGALEALYDRFADAGNLTAKIYVLDEQAKQSGFPALHPRRTDTVKRTLLALDQIQGRLENELDTITGHDERQSGYRAGISEALVQVMDTRKSLTAQR
ncbi:hypothetical protein [Rhodococcus kronopolitis]|uniref:Uncharacterized protein n=1 Tax=Rhodococcus kronopolitis TaxID=1460226 RepID=A0ABV9FPA5_9NOCA